MTQTSHDNGSLKVLDLFSGIGGFSLGLEQAGMETVAFCEVAEFPRKVLEKHWPGVPVYMNVRRLRLARLIRDGVPHPDVICGGFPCQDISLAGSGAGLSGERSGLWFEFHRLIKEIRPKFAIIENVAALRSRGLDEVLRGLAEIGYDAEWHCIPAAAVGAPHRRDRIWIVAYPNGVSRDPRGVGDSNEGTRGRNADRSGVGRLLAHPHQSRLEVLLHGKAGELAATLGTSPWAIEPDVGRVAYGVPSRVDRIKSLGNAVVPQIPEIIGQAIRRALA